MLVLSFVFSLSAVTASAADTNEQDELVTFILEYDKSCEVYELSDGTTVVFGVIPAASTYAGYDIEKATARPTATHTYTCSANLGDECRGAIENIDEEKRKLANKVYSGFDKAKFCPTEKDGEVIYENLKKWIEKFKELLINQKQERLFGNLVGRLLAYSPIGGDGYSPCEAVRMVIEEYYTDSLKTAYVVAEENKRGVHMVDAGKSEIILHQRYQKNAEALQERYPYTADIYFAISDNYKREAEYERKRAEDEW